MKVLGSQSHIRIRSQSNQEPRSKIWRQDLGCIWVTLGAGFWRRWPTPGVSWGLDTGPTRTAAYGGGAGAASTAQGESSMQPGGTDRRLPSSPWPRPSASASHRHYGHHTKRRRYRAMCAQKMSPDHNSTKLTWSLTWTPRDRSSGACPMCQTMSSDRENTERRHWKFRMGVTKGGQRLSWRGPRRMRSPVTVERCSSHLPVAPAGPTDGCKPSRPTSCKPSFFPTRFYSSPPGVRFSLLLQSPSSYKN